MNFHPLFDRISETATKLIQTPRRTYNILDHNHLNRTCILHLQNVSQINGIETFSISSDGSCHISDHLIIFTPVKVYLK